jgi:hypothetical protein
LRARRKPEMAAEAVAAGGSCSGLKPEGRWQGREAKVVAAARVLDVDGAGDARSKPTEDEAKPKVDAAVREAEVGGDEAAGRSWCCCPTYAAWILAAALLLARMHANAVAAILLLPTHGRTCSLGAGHCSCCMHASCCGFARAS